MKKNIQALRDDLIDLFYQVRSGQVKPVVATEMNNAAGKALAAAKLEIEYLREKQRNKDLKICFFETGK